MGLFDDVLSSITKRTGTGGADRTTDPQSTGETTAPARCLYGGDSFVVHFDRADGAWTVTDAVAAASGSSDRAVDPAREVRIHGPFDFLPSYAGCPHCGDTGLFHCVSCDRLACWDGETSPVVCPWCEERVEIEGRIDSVESYEEADAETAPDRSSTGVTDSSTTDRIGRK